MKLKKTIKVIKELLDLLYIEKDKKYALDVEYIQGITKISIYNMYENKQIFNIEIDGNIEVYDYVMASITNLVIGNEDAFGCLMTSNMFGSREIKKQFIQTKNVEISLPLYTASELIIAESNNNIMLEKRFSNTSNKKKVLINA